MDDVMKSDNVGVLQVLEEGDLSDGHARAPSLCSRQISFRATSWSVILEE